MTVEPRDEDVKERVWPLQVHGVAGTVDDLEVGTGDGGGEPLTEGDELRVERAGNDEGGNAQVAQLIPQGSLGAGAGSPQARRQSAGGVGEPLGPSLAGDVESGEQRLRQPLVEERGNADGLDPVGQRLVGRAPSFSLPNVVYAPRRADQDETGDEVGPGQRGVQAQPAPHGVAHVGRSTAGRRQPRAALDQIQIKIAGGTVARRVQRNGFVPGTGHATGKFVPGASGLGEPVDEDETSQDE